MTHPRPKLCTHSLLTTTIFQIEFNKNQLRKFSEPVRNRESCWRQLYHLHRHVPERENRSEIFGFLAGGNSRVTRRFIFQAERKPILRIWRNITVRRGSGSYLSNHRQRYFRDRKTLVEGRPDISPLTQFSSWSSQRLYQILGPFGPIS